MIIYWAPGQAPCQVLQGLPHWPPTSPAQPSLRWVCYSPVALRPRKSLLTLWPQHSLPNRIMMTRVQVWGAELGFASKLGSATVGIPILLVLGWTASDKPKKSATDTRRNKVKENWQKGWYRERELLSRTSCLQHRVLDSKPKLGTAWVPKNIHTPGQSTATPRNSSTHTQEQLFLHRLVTWGEGGAILKEETVQILEAQAGSHSGLDEMQYNEDANKRTCSLPTHCLPTPPGHISDTQPVVPMERKGTCEQRVHAATHPHTAVLSLLAWSQVWVFLFSPSFYFPEKFTLKSNISSPYTHLLYN